MQFSVKFWDVNVTTNNQNGDKKGKKCLKGNNLVLEVFDYIELDLLNQKCLCQKMVQRSNISNNYMINHQFIKHKELASQT